MNAGEPVMTNFLMKNEKFSILQMVYVKYSKAQIIRNCI